VEQLSDILRQLLAGENVQEVPLAEEIALIRKFLAIEQVRFSDRLKVEWSIARETDAAFVPSFALQPLVENALRHGVAVMSEPGTVVIETRAEGGDLVIRVANDVPTAGSRDAHQGAGVGIRNTRERLVTLYGARASLTLVEEPRRVVAVMRLPFREGPISLGRMGP
jgi:LytS/YehU family sensor histidine kinase